MSDTRRFIEIDAKARLLATVVAVALPITSAVAGWTFVQLWDHEGRLRTIEASRYTREHADADRRRADADRLTLERVLIRLDTRTAEIDKQLTQIMESIKRLEERQR